MSVTLILPPQLRNLSGGRAEIDVNAKDVDSALTAIDRKFPGIAVSVRNELGEPRKHIMIYVNDEEIRLQQGMKTAVRDGDRVFIIAALSGG